MAITLGGVTTGSSTLSSETITKPSGVVDGSLLIIAIAHNSAKTYTTPSGWTARRSPGTWGSTSAYAIFYKIVTSAGSEPSTYTLVSSATGSHDWICAAYSGVDATTPFDIATDVEVKGNTSSLVATSVTTVTDGALLLDMYVVNNVSATATPPGSMTVEASTNVRVLMRLADETIATAGATGTRTWSSSVTTTQGVYQTALRPASGGGVDHPLSGTAAGTSSASATALTLSHPLSGTATGASSASASSLALAQPLSGTAASTSAASATRLSLSHPLSGTAVGTSSASATQLIVNNGLSGTATATSSASATGLTLSHPLSGLATALSSASATRITMSHPLSGAAAATSSATADLGSLASDHPLSGTATATSSASATRLTLSHPLTGSAAGTSSATATAIRLSHPLAGTAAAQSLGIAAGIVLSHPLSGMATATSSASAELGSLLPYAPPGNAAMTMRPGITATMTQRLNPTATMTQRPNPTATVVQRGGT